MIPGQTHYEVLGVNPQADATTVRRAYVAKARVYHPDFHVAASAEVRAHAEEQMRIINAAWAVLGSHSSRARYDRELHKDGRFPHAEPARSGSGPAPRTAPEHTSGTAPPRWLTVLPAFFLFLALGSFAVGMVTGLAVLLGGAVVFGLLGAVLFVLVPVLAMNRSRRGSRRPSGPTVSA